jgi:hypothetical protein
MFSVDILERVCVKEVELRDGVEAKERKEGLEGLRSRVSE